MEEHNDILDTKPLSPGAAQVRALVMEGRVSLEDFAAGIGKSVRTVFAYISEGMPTDYIGNTPYPRVPESLDWLTKRRSQPLPPPRARGRPRKQPA